MNKKNRFYKKLTALIATGLMTAAVSGTAFAADFEVPAEGPDGRRHGQVDALESAPHDGPDAFLEYDGLPHRRRYV